MSGLLAYTILSLHAILHNNNQIFEMRELARISFLREILRSMLLRELQYLLHPTLVRGLVGVLANTLLPNGCEVLMESWNV